MTEDIRPRLWGWVLPEARTVLWGTVILSVAAYFIFEGQATANLIAIIGAVLLTVVLYKREKLDEPDG